MVPDKIILAPIHHPSARGSSNIRYPNNAYPPLLAAVIDIIHTMRLTDTLKLTAPLTVVVCTEEGAALSALVNSVHMSELHTKMSPKQTPRNTKSEIYMIALVMVSMSISKIAYMGIHRQRKCIK